MPSRNRVKQYAANHVYHLYNRGNNREAIFIDDEDYAVFLNLLKRHLSFEVVKDESGRPYRKLYGVVELLAFCLMPNHFHMLVYQHTPTGMTDLLRSVGISYAGYFNKKYHRVGRVFQDAFKASLIDEDTYWQHISRYIHLNPSNWRDWEWSSLGYFLGAKKTDWIHPEKIIADLNPDEYLAFVSDYDDHKNMLGELKYIRAD